jgi:hypothetical protein
MTGRIANFFSNFQIIEENETLWEISNDPISSRHFGFMNSSD